jgi:hypothetical protein
MPKTSKAMYCKLRKRKGGAEMPLGVAAPGPDQSTETGLGPGLGQAPQAPQAPGLGQAPGAQDDMFSPPPVPPTAPRPLVPGPTTAPVPVPVPVPPPTPSIFGKLLATVTSPFKKKEVETPQTNQGGLFSSNSNVSIFSPSTWFGGKTKRHGKKSKTKNNNKAKSNKVKSKKHKSKKH